jgi:hypothetical protein
MTITTLPAPITPVAPVVSVATQRPLRRSLRPGSTIRVTQDHIDAARETRESNPAFCRGRHSAITYAIRSADSGYRPGILSVDAEARSICVYYQDPVTGAAAGYAQIALPAEAQLLAEMEDCGVWDKVVPLTFRLGRCIDADAAVWEDFGWDAAGEGTTSNG